MAKIAYLEKGLTPQQAKSRLQEFGYNEIKTKREFRALKILLSQFTSFLIIILAFAGGISLALGEYVDGFAIIGILLINAIIGFFQEYKAENAVAALKKMVVPKTIVIRDGKEKEIPVRELVPDDIVILEEGAKIPADLEIIESFSLMVDEAMLTGESVPASKKAGKGKIGLLFKGTIVATGRAKAKVIGTGTHTEFGKIVELVSKQTKSRSPLAVQLDNLGKKLGLVILGLVLILFILGEIRDIPLLHMFMTSVALGVSAIPEGMPIIVTLTLAMGVQTLARKKAIVRKMNSIETLGATTVICSDKTGTLTLNEMTVKKIFSGGKEHSIPGLGYKWKEKIKLTTPEEKKLLQICENCNNSYVDKEIHGDPTEIALKVLTRKARQSKTFKKLDENVFTSERKMMSTLHKIERSEIPLRGSSKKELFAKGAFEVIIKKSTHILKNGKVKKLTPTDRKTLNKIAKSYAEDALRVLGMAYKEGNGKTENNLIFVGLVGMIDPPRDTVARSIALAQKAHIKVKIITGDNPITAKAIGENIGLDVTNVITGDEIDKLKDSELYEVIQKTEIFARTSPQHKYRIVDLLKRHHEVVAVTGDGVNDAPALKHGDVGVAMGIKGTEATKEVADIILKDDNFTTIVNTIKEGRRIYHNILAFIKYMLSANFDTIMAVGVLTIMGYPLPILPLQILWVNIATDALPALALGKSEASPGIMEEKPHKKHERIFHKFFDFIIVAAILQTAVNLALYFYGAAEDATLGIHLSQITENSHARTMVFTEIVMFELLFVFVCKEEKLSSLKNFFNNKYLIVAATVSFLAQLVMLYSPHMQTVFKTVPLSLTEWGLIILCALTAFLVPPVTGLIRKLYRK